MYNVYIAKAKNIRPAENADRLNLCEVFGNTTVVDKSVNENDLYLYFPVGGALSEEFGNANNLFRKKDAEGKNIGGFIDPDKRNICAIKLRGNRSDGLVLPLSALEPFGDVSQLKEGDIVTTFNGHVIAEKYIPRTNHRSSVKSGNRTRKISVPVAPLFAEHVETEQLPYNLKDFKNGDFVEISLKLHGTSARTAYLPKLVGFKRSLADRIFHREGKPQYEYGYISGTRRTVLDSFGSGGFYGDNGFREVHAKAFEGKMPKGFTAYYEIVGFTDNGTPIMGTGDNKKLGEDFVKQYGKTTVFSYGCEPNGKKTMYGKDEEGYFSIEQDRPIHDAYLYRLTYTTPEGLVMEISPDDMRHYAEMWGIKTVPVLWRGIIPDDVDAGEWIKAKAEEFYDGPDPIGKTHIREGVVVRIVNAPSFKAYKIKPFSFKMLAGIISEKLAQSGATDKMADDVLAEL